MVLDTLLGNDRLKKNLSAALEQGKTSHFYLIRGPNGSGRHTLARLLAAGLQCQEAEKPCGTCTACRKALANTHPDIITVDDPEKKTVSIELVRKTQSEVYIRPNEGRKKIYLFPRAQDMGIPAQNAFLKSLEEPPPYGVFLLLTDAPEKLLPTIRSRCTLLRLQPLSRETLMGELKKRWPEKDADTLQAAAERSGGYLGQALAVLEEGTDLYPQTQSFVEAIVERSAIKLLETTVRLEKNKRDALLPILQQWEELLQQAIVARAGGTVTLSAARTLATAREGAELQKFLKAVRRGVDSLQGNASPGTVCGWLFWNLR